MSQTTIDTPQLEASATDVLSPGLLLSTLRALGNGDFDVSLPLHYTGVAGEIAESLNAVIALNRRLCDELARMSLVVGKEGRLKQRASIGDVGGGWGSCVDSVNALVTDLVQPTTEVGRVIGSVASGDLSQKMTLEIDSRPLEGEFLRTAKVVNGMVEQLGSFASEVTRVAREVGTEGKLGGQARVEGVAGTWQDLTESVNLMATNLTAQVRSIAEVTTAVAKGDLSKKITVDVRGEILELKNTINTMVDQLNSFASEVTRVAREVGTEGKLGGQARVQGVAGTWKDLTLSVNSMASNLTAQVRNIAEVTTAVAKGDLSKKITVNVQGEILELKDTINTMVDQLNAFASEVTRVAREVGTMGILGGQAEVRGVAGTWKDLTDSVNSIVSNLTDQVRNIAEVTTAVARGDLSKKITVDVKGEILQLKVTINTMVDQLNAFASEVTRVAREVGTMGILGGQGEVRGVAGTWKDLTDSVNSMASNLTDQVRNVADVTTAVAQGDLSKKITVDVKGEMLQLKNTINTMVDQLNAFASEVTRVAREVGTEGKLGGQAEVPGVSGTWKDLTDNVNSMASNLTAQVRNIAAVTTAVATGDLSKKITVDVRGEILELKDTINTMVDQLNAFASEVTRVAREVGTEGKLGGQAEVRGVAGTWKDLTDNVNSMASNLTGQVRNIADVTTAVAMGDLSRKITVDVKGEILELKNTINTMVDQLNAFASEVTRVAREVGTEGKLGGQAEVRGVAGTWKDLTDNVNSMASNLTDQVRGIAKVVTAVANGDMGRKLALEASGEIAQLADTINSMTATLGIFAEQIITVAREVGVEGKLGGQAKVPGASGTWRDLTDNVNQLAANLTTQVRAIGDVATAVTKGDLTRYITVAASGEVAMLKDNINEMIRNLKETTRKTTEQDWLKTNLARFTRMLQGQRDLETVAQQVLSELAPLVSAQHGAFYVAEREESGELQLQLLGGYASPPDVIERFHLGQGLVGQCALEKRKIRLLDVPPEYVKITSGLGSASAQSLMILPVLFEGQVNAVIEIASFTPLSEIDEMFLDQLTESIAIVVNTISSSMRTEELLKQSQSLTQELQTQQEELRQTNDRLELQAATLRESEERLRQQQDELKTTNEQLEEKAKLLEVKNREVEFAKAELEEKAEQLALTSKYKSEFLANMSHELRTPLNSLLILSRMLSDNVEQNLTPKQVEFARTIHGAGTDLLALINDILDLSKVESGTIGVEPGELRLRDLSDYVDQNFRHVAKQKGLEFEVKLAPDVPASIVTDGKRLQQVLKNLLSNAVKFTETGAVTLEIAVARSGWSRDHQVLNGADQVVALSVVDTGIGIPDDKQHIIFEAFQQADGTTSRRYGGTGLGLSISREIARRLGGEIGVTSAPGGGSTFTFFLPRLYVPLPQPATTRAASSPNPFVYEAPVLVHELVTPAPPSSMPAADDRETISSGDAVFLLVEDDTRFARILIDVIHDLGFKALAAAEGREALALATKHELMGVALDLRLPDIDGWAVLDRLKHDSATRHVPVAVFSAEPASRKALRLGARCFVEKPASLDDVTRALVELKHFGENDKRRLLVIEDDALTQKSIAALVDSTGVEVVQASSGEEALAQLERAPFDCVVLDLGLPDMSGFSLLSRVRQRSELGHVPIVVYTGRELTPTEETELTRLAETIVVKDARSPERLLDEVCLFLHRRESALPEPQRVILEDLHREVPELEGKTILVVDDDVRNIFAVTSALELHRAAVVYAENGRDGLELLERTPKVDAVLMDIMMPEMDGYEVMRRIRAQPRFEGLPIVAVTAKAMRADREKCMEAGANDYIAKPVDMDNLISLLRVSLSS
jgi:HAMP domain-containing protein/signal transduction histidine kinase/DNA-binding response OmpR family regulator